jgi:hypothetical protein
MRRILVAVVGVILVTLTVTAGGCSHQPCQGHGGVVSQQSAPVVAGTTKYYCADGTTEGP